MKIIEIELINHVVLPASIHIDLRKKTNNNLVSINGKNGSGKSFLVSCLHPLSSNSRYNKKYSIIPESNGYKRLVYNVSNEHDIEIIHEYVSNKKGGHSCKSYINQIDLVTGNTHELNKTGHTIKFAELVKKHLNYDTTTSVVASLSPRTPSLSNMVSTDRRKVLESIMNLTGILSSYQKNNRELLSEAKMTLKVYSNQITDMYDRMEYNSVGELTSALVGMEHDVKILQEDIDKLNTDRNAYENKIASLVRDESGIILRTLRITRDVMSEMKYNTVSELMMNKKRYEGVTEKVHIKTASIIDENKKLERFKELKLSNHRIKSLLESHANELLEINSSLKEDLKNNTSVENVTNVMTLLDKLSRIADDIGHGEFSKIVNIISDKRVTVENIEKRLMDEMESIQLFIDKYNGYLSMNDDSDNIDTGGFKFNGGCNICPYYEKFIKSKDFIKVNHDKYDSDNERLDEIKETLLALTNYKMHITNLKSLTKTITSLVSAEIVNRLDIEDLDKWFVHNVVASQSHIIDELRTRFKIEFNRAGKLRDQISEHKGLLIGMDNDDSVVELDRRIEDNKKKLVELMDGSTVARNFEKRCEVFLDSFDELDIVVLRKHKDSGIDAIDTELKEIANVDSLSKQYSAKLEHINYSHSLKNIDRDMKNKEYAKLESDKESLLLSSKYARQTGEDIKVYSKLKDILEKKIPIKLLSENIETINVLVNSILEENNIEILIDIICEDEEVKIPVFINRKQVDDVSMCSTGEGALISITLSAVLCYIAGYSVLNFDEIEANLDGTNREKMTNLLYSIQSKLNIGQIFCVSHHISQNLPATHIVIGEYNCDYFNEDDIIHI